MRGKHILASTLILMVIPLAGIAQGGTGDTVRSLLVPAMVAAIGYLAKSLYDVMLERERRKRALLEEKLKTFYWPILTRLEENEAIFTLVFEKHSGDPLLKDIATYAEKNVVLQNHLEIMDIVSQYRYLAKFDAELMKLLNKYIRHVIIYKSIQESGSQKYPGNLGAPYPREFDAAIRARTEKLQQELDTKRI
jgi:hypothetical protein